MSRTKLLAVTLTVAMLLSGVAAVGTAAQGVWADEHTSPGNGEVIQVTVENATVVVVNDMSNVPVSDTGTGDMNETGQADDNETGIGTDDNETGVGDNETDAGMDDNETGSMGTETGAADNVTRMDGVMLNVTIEEPHLVDLQQTGMGADMGTNETDTGDGSTAGMTDARDVTVPHATVFVVVNDDEFTGGNDTSSLTEGELDAVSVFVVVHDGTGAGAAGDTGGMGADNATGGMADDNETDTGMDDNETGVGTDDNETGDMTAGMAEGGEVSIDTATIFVYAQGSLEDLMGDTGTTGTDTGMDDNETGVGTDDNETDTGMDDNETGVGTDDNETGVGTDDNETDTGMDDNETGVGTEDTTGEAEGEWTVTVEQATIYVFVQEQAGMDTGDDIGADDTEDEDAGVGADNETEDDGIGDDNETDTGMDDNETDDIGTDNESDGMDTENESDEGDT